MDADFRDRHQGNGSRALPRGARRRKSDQTNRAGSADRVPCSSSLSASSMKPRTAMLKTNGSAVRPNECRWGFHLLNEGVSIPGHVSRRELLKAGQSIPRWHPIHATWCVQLRRARSGSPIILEDGVQNWDSTQARNDVQHVDKPAIPPTRRFPYSCCYPVMLRQAFKMPMSCSIAFPRALDFMTTVAITAEPFVAIRNGVPWRVERGITPRPEKGGFLLTLPDSMIDLLNTVRSPAEISIRDAILRLARATPWVMSIAHSDVPCE